MSYSESCESSEFVEKMPTEGLPRFRIVPFSTILHIITTLEVSNEAVWAIQKEMLFSQKDVFIKKK